MKACCFTFVHDFDAYLPLKKQLPKVEEKYRRRIARFYKDIKEKTLFIRYINPNEDVKWIEENQHKIEEELKSFNPNNRIIYISNCDVRVNIV